MSCCLRSQCTPGVGSGFDSCQVWASVQMSTALQYSQDPVCILLCDAQVTSYWSDLILKLSWGKMIFLWLSEESKFMLHSLVHLLEQCSIFVFNSSACGALKCTCTITTDAALQSCCMSLITGFQNLLSRLPLLYNLCPVLLWWILSTIWAVSSSISHRSWRQRRTFQFWDVSWWRGQLFSTTCHQDQKTSSFTNALSLAIHPVFILFFSVALTLHNKAREPGQSCCCMTMKS